MPLGVYDSVLSRCTWHLEQLVSRCLHGADPRKVRLYDPREVRPYDPREVRPYDPREVRPYDPREVGPYV